MHVPMVIVVRHLALVFNVMTKSGREEEEEEEEEEKERERGEEKRDK